MFWISTPHKLQICHTNLETEEETEDMFDQCHLQVIVHDGDVQADVVHAVRRDVEDDGLVVGGVQGVLLDARLLLFQTPPVTDERHFDVRV